MALGLNLNDDRAGEYKPLPGGDEPPANPPLTCSSKAKRFLYEYNEEGRTAAIDFSVIWYWQGVTLAGCGIAEAVSTTAVLTAWQIIPAVLALSFITDLGYQLITSGNPTWRGALRDWRQNRFTTPNGEIVDWRRGFGVYNTIASTIQFGTVVMAINTADAWTNDAVIEGSGGYLGDFGGYLVVSTAKDMVDKCRGGEGNGFIHNLKYSLRGLAEIAAWYNIQDLNIATRLTSSIGTGAARIVDSFTAAAGTAAAFLASGPILKAAASIPSCAKNLGSSLAKWWCGGNKATVPKGISSINSDASNGVVYSYSKIPEI